MVDMDGIAGMADMDGIGMVDIDGIGVMTWGTIGIGGGDASKWTWANARPAHTKKQATQAVRCRAVDTLPPMARQNIAIGRRKFASIA